jgi:hypothetical protein
VLRSIFGPKRDEVTGGWRRLHNEARHNFYSSPSIIRMMKLRRMRWTGHVARMKSNLYRTLVGKPEGRGPLRRPRRRWVDNIKIDLRAILVGLGGIDWINLAHDRYQWRTLVNTAMDFRGP